MSKRTPLQKIRDAYREGRGTRLTAEDVRELWQYDDALQTRLSNEEDGEDWIPNAWEE
jgi:hypothetical protein